MASNSKSIYDQLQEMILKVESLEREMKSMKMSYEAQISALKLEIKQKDEKIVKLENENARLRAQLDKNSSNSSKPPSSDNKIIKPVINNRAKTTKKTGGQKNHKGSNLSKKSIEEKIKSGTVEHIVVEHKSFEYAEKYVSKYIVDTKTIVVVTEHRFYENNYGKIIVPNNYKTDVQYGSNIKALTVMLNTLEVVAINRLKCFISAITNDAITMSTGTIMNFINELGSKTTSYIEQIENKLLNTPVVHTDATGTNCNGKNIYVRNYSNDNYTLYRVNESKSKATLNKDSLLSKYMGTLVHDHETVMYNYGVKHGECNVHIIRYLKATLENTKNKWSKDLISFLCCLNEHVKNLKTNGVTCLSKEQLEKYETRYDEIINNGFTENKTTKQKYAREDEKKLLNRLKKYKDNHMLFLYDFNVPFDNNMSERDLRHIKTKTKVSGCFRSLEGTKAFANIRSIISTCNKQKKNIFEIITTLFNNSPIYI